MIFTHCGKFGDMLMCLPILSAWWKKTGEKPGLALAQFPYAKESIELLKLQECIGGVYDIEYWPGECWGGFPYKPLKIVGMGEEFINLGFRAYPDKSLIEFVAEEHGLDIDWGFVLNIGGEDRRFPVDAVVIDRYDRPMLEPAGIRGVYLKKENGLLMNLRVAAGAAKVFTYATGAAMALGLARIAATVYVTQSDYAYHRDKVYNRMPWLDLQPLEGF